MVDVITRFKLETTQYDSKLRDAAKGISDVAHQAELAGQGFNNFSQKSVEAARALGQTASGATNAKDKVRDMVGAYNEAAKAYNKLTQEQQQSDFGKALAQSLTQLKGRITEAKQELYGLGNAVEQVKSKSSGLFGEGGLTGMLAVTGGNLLASGITQLGSEIADTMQKSIELARAGEGVRKAFERLNNPGLLNNLKEATHGTVSELELMKAAVKFDDFKLPVEQLGTLLAFAQKKAKDTGQSVDYMVDSIVTGLGRKSLMILDNLGLSAAQIKEKMAETGDMTKAVAEIIKEQMAQAGEYVETAADRAARAAADAANKMEDLGNKAMPVAEEWSRAWNEISLGGMTLLNTVLGPIADSIRSIREALNSEFKFKPGIPNLADGPQSPWAGWKPGSDHKVQAPGGYVEITDKNNGAVIGGQHFDNLQDTNAINAWRKSLSKTTSNKGSKTPAQQAQEKVAQALHDYQQSIEMAQMEMKSGAITEADAKKKELQAQQRLWDAYGDAYNIYKNPKYKEAQDKAAAEIVKLGGEVKAAKDAAEKLKVKWEQGASGFNAKTMNAWMQGRQSDLSKAEYGSADYSKIIGNIADMNTIKTVLEQSIKAGIDAAQFDLEPLWEKVFDGENIPDSTWQSMVDKINEKLKELNIEPIKIDFKTGNIAKDGKEVAKDWNNAASAISSVGSAMSQIEDPAAKVVGTVAQAIASIALGYATATTQAASMGPWAWVAFAAAGMAQMISMISTIHSATGYAEGGIIKGNSYSGDRIGGLVDGSQLVGLNSGELILNRFQQQALAANLQNNNGGGMHVIGEIQGEKIVLVANRYFKRTGQGEILTW